MYGNQVFHEGEIAIQKKAGEVFQARRNAEAISDIIMTGALKFIEQQHMVILGSLDQNQDVWASVLFGQPGFIIAPDEKTVFIHHSETTHNPNDPFWDNIELDQRVGMLVIELSTRRRLRINGTVTRVDENRLKLDVDEAYPNCPKYISKRIPSNNNHGELPEINSTTGTELSSELINLIESGDTFFVASANPRGGVDASHRGGAPGFVKILDNTTLRIPDYQGNSMFNTMGNFETFPHAGLLFIDFQSNRLVQLTGKPTIRWDLEDNNNETGGTSRFWDFAVEKWIDTNQVNPFTWEFQEYSPYNPG